MAEYKKINEPTNNDEEKVIDDDKNDSNNKVNQEVQKNTEDFKKVGKGCIGCLAFLFLIGGCTLFLSNDSESKFDKLYKKCQKSVQNSLVYPDTYMTLAGGYVSIGRTSNSETIAFRFRYYGMKGNSARQQSKDRPYIRAIARCEMNFNTNKVKIKSTSISEVFGDTDIKPDF
tara:strand:- start:81 stop:599 length:519 start_codon:yes stop_codon:yes gene_type:complete